MSGRRIAALVRRVAQEIRRDRPSLALLFIAPIVITGLLAFILREGQTPTVDAAIVSGGSAPGAAIATSLTTSLEAEGATVIAASDEDAALAMIQDGTASIAIVLPATVTPGTSLTITLITDGLDPSGEANQIAVVSKAMVSTAAGVAGVTLPTIVHETLYGTPSSDPITNYAPPIVGFFVYFFVYMLTGVSFLRERTGGTLERLMATPVARGEVVVGYTVGFLLFATIQVAILMTWVLGSVAVPAIGPLPAFSIGLGVPIAGSPVLAFLVVLFAAAGAVSLGIFLSTFARTELQIIQFIPLVIVPQFLLSGVLFPVSSLPEILQPLTKIMPLSYAVDGLRQVFVAGADLTTAALQLDLAVLAIIVVFFATIASLTIRRDVV